MGEGTDAVELRKTLQKFGFSNAAIEAAWPDWWTVEAEGSSSARAELRFSLSRKLGLDPAALLREGQPRFVWKDEAKFKRFSGSSDEAAALASFGTSIGRALVSATTTDSRPGLSAREIREAILAQSNYVDLNSLVSFCWAVGLPVVQLRVFPLAAKRMCAMSVQWSSRHAIMLGQATNYAAQMAFYLAHELGHVYLGHVADGHAIVDVDDVLRPGENDVEERQADEFALELLTGHRELSILPTTDRFIAPQLAETAVRAALELRIDPGTIVLCLGYATGRWPQVFSALNRLGTVKDMWRTINGIAREQMRAELFEGDYGDFIRAVLELPGGPSRHRQ